MKYGCIGEHLKHSFSKEIHETFADYSYEICEIPKSDIDNFMKKSDFSAINVTIPYKETVIPYLDEISPQALSIGAVNTIVNVNGKLFGHNTDYFGMLALIKKNNIDCKDKKVLILEKEFLTDKYGIAVQKGNTELLNELNTALEELDTTDFEEMMNTAISVQPLSQ